MLYRALEVVTRFQDDAVQFKLSESFREEMSRRIVIQEEKSLDILQGILVLAAWYSLPHLQSYYWLSLSNKHRI